MEATYDELELTELDVYVAQGLEADRAGGATKLNKILFFADFAHVRRTGGPITGAAYQKLLTVPHHDGSSPSATASSPEARLS